MSSIIASKSSIPLFKKYQTDDSSKFQPLPEPTGSYPFHLPIEHIIPSVSSQKLVFHMVGDTGSILNPDFQKLVAEHMISQYEGESKEEDQPQFLYHLGDIVYNFGEAGNYPAQFFGPYHKYPAPIFSIPGNHDSDVNPDSLSPYNSLDAFKAVFCDYESRNISFSGSTRRSSMVQPNIYWTLQTPLANIIGLYSNVPKYGIITAEQRAWFIEELKTADKDRPQKALIVCLHHSPYSADTNHGSSLPMIAFLESSFAETGIRPDIVFSGHVHNYQRFEKQYSDGHIVPFVVAGGGGYDELHSLALTDDERYSGEYSAFEGVHLRNYCDNYHGFLKIRLEKKDKGLTLTGEYYTIAWGSELQGDKITSPVDVFTLSIE